MEIDLETKLEVARQNVATLQEQLKTSSAETSRLNTLVTKWTGVVEYLESLLPVAPPDDGHGKESAVPGKESEKVEP